MATCANCESKAEYFLSFTNVYYCGRHLPFGLKEPAAAGRLALPKVKVAAPVEAPVETVIVEAPVEETPKPSKKAPEGK